MEFLHLLETPSDRSWQDDARFTIKPVEAGRCRRDLAVDCSLQLQDQFSISRIVVAERRYLAGYPRGFLLHLGIFGNDRERADLIAKATGAGPIGRASGRERGCQAV